MPKVPNAAYCTVAPDWICEVLSPSTDKHDREVKMPVHARELVRHACARGGHERGLYTSTVSQGATARHIS